MLLKCVCALFWSFRIEYFRGNLILYIFTTVVLSQLSCYLDKKLKETPTARRPIYSTYF